MSGDVKFNLGVNIFATNPYKGLINDTEKIGATKIPDANDKSVAVNADLEYFFHPQTALRINFIVPVIAKDINHTSLINNSGWGGNHGYRGKSSYKFNAKNFGFGFGFKYYFLNNKLSINTDYFLKSPFETKILTSQGFYDRDGDDAEVSYWTNKAYEIKPQGMIALNYAPGSKQNYSFGIGALLFKNNNKDTKVAPFFNVNISGFLD